MAEAGPAAAGLGAQTVGAFLAQLSSDRPAPGGGAAAAVALAMGRALLAMAAGVGNRRSGPAGDPMLATIAGTEGGASPLALDLAERDVEAFARVLEALAMGRTDASERERRREALATAARRATREGEAAARTCLEALQAAQSLAGRLGGSIAGDARAGAILIRAALAITLDNLASNAGLLPGAEGEAVRAQVAALAAAAEGTDAAVERADGGV